MVDQPGNPIAHVLLGEVDIDAISNFHTVVHQIAGERLVVCHCLAVEQTIGGVTVPEFVRRAVGKGGLRKEQSQALVERDVAVAAWRIGGQGLCAPLVVDGGIPGRIGRQVGANKLIPGAGNRDQFRDVEQEGGRFLLFLVLTPNSGHCLSESLSKSMAKMGDVTAALARSPVRRSRAAIARSRQ